VSPEARSEDSKTPATLSAVYVEGSNPPNRHQRRKFGRIAFINPSGGHAVHPFASAGKTGCPHPNRPAIDAHPLFKFPANRDVWFA